MPLLIQWRESDAQRALAHFADDQFGGRTGEVNCAACFGSRRTRLHRPQKCERDTKATARNQKEIGLTFALTLTFSPRERGQQPDAFSDSTSRLSSTGLSAQTATAEE
jgi:hypothetical protein